MSASTESRPCRRCKTTTTLTVRKDPLCETCYEAHILQRVAKALSKPYKEVKEKIGSGKAKYLLGLSFGHSSTAVVQILDKNLQGLHERNLRVAYEVHVVHVDTDLSSPAVSSPLGSPAKQLVDKYTHQFPNLQFGCVPLTAALKLDTIDWSVLPALQTELEPAQQLSSMLEALPSTAKGRGFAVPWQVQDGPVPITRFPRRGDGEASQRIDKQEKTMLPVYYLLRDVFKREAITYTGLVQPPIRHLIQAAAPSTSAIVSHKELSIEDVMAKYFEEVEESYPSVVANVVRTSGKLARLNDGEACALCGMALDEKGDARWKGEIGEDQNDSKRKETAGRICYGCQRSICG
ncbi:Cytoplasmic tRNA 2-thiolation protein 2 [Colletotrichum spinosum]|uniref:Cytoplasmic tRNA 2-thiolation protein 2 n=1 Tax=Colletotrichum spinosum TaxID=1347390 RepID=A0A4R8PXY4_9PEZI|nr:Cytoplasmic tRNA 2-thiolation protein 2 [Colletotrichum spinosum]